MAGERRKLHGLKIADAALPWTKQGLKAPNISISLQNIVKEIRIIVSNRHLDYLEIPVLHWQTSEKKFVQLEYIPQIYSP